MKAKPKPPQQIFVCLTRDEASALQYLLAEAASGWGEPFKDYEGPHKDPDSVPGKIMRRIQVALRG